MRNIIVATAAGLGLAVSFIGGWATSTSHARVATPAVNPLQIMTSAKNCRLRSSWTTPSCSEHSHAELSLDGYLPPTLYLPLSDGGAPRCVRLGLLLFLKTVAARDFYPAPIPREATSLFMLTLLFSFLFFWGRQNNPGLHRQHSVIQGISQASIGNAVTRKMEGAWGPLGQLRSGRARD